MSTDKELDILQAIDSETFKYAQQKIAKHLKKFPNSLYYQALNSLLHFSMGKKIEAERICLGIIEKTPTDFNTLYLMNDILRRLKLFKESSSIFENAYKISNNLELVNSWFALSLEHLDIMSLQKASMILQKRKSDKLSVLWASFNCYLAMGEKSLSALEQKLFPNLGLKLIESLKPFQSEQMIFVNVKLLSCLGKHEEIVQILDESKAYEKDLELQLIYLDVLQKLGHWTKLNEVSYSILHKERDDYKIWCYFIESSFISGQQDKVLPVLKEYKASRNSRLAFLEYAKFSGNGINNYAEYYYNQYQTSLCVFPDLSNYIDLPIFDKKMFKEFLSAQYATKKTEIFSNAEPSMDQCLYLVNYTKFRCKFEPDLLSSIEFFEDNLLYYNHTKYLIESKLDTDYFAGDEFILNCVYYLVNQYQLTNDIKYVLQSVLILEDAVSRDIHEFRLKLWLVHLYNHLNCYALAKSHFDSLRIKYLQVETLNHYLNSRISSINPNVRINQIYGVWVSCEGDAYSCLKKAYNNGCFNKIEEMIKLSRMLKGSIAQASMLIEMSKTARLKNDKSNISKALKQLNRFITSDGLTLFDNRDLNIISRDFQSKLGIPNESSSWVEAMYLKEQIVAEGNPESLESQITKLSELLEKTEKTENKEKEVFLTAIETWSLELILLLSNLYQNRSTNISPIVAKLKNIPVYNKSTWEVNHHNLTILETLKSMQYFINNHNFSFVKTMAELRKAIMTLNEQIETDIPSFKKEKNLLLDHDRDDLVVWGEKNSLSKTFTTSVLRGIRDCSDNSISLMRAV